jgi:hypothetical protein
MLSTLFTARGRVAVTLAAVSVAVCGLAQAATLALTGQASDATVGRKFEFRPSVSGTSGRALVYGLTTNVSWLTINRSTGLVSGTPATSDVGTAYILVFVGDGAKRASMRDSFSVKPAANKAPTITGAPTVSGLVGKAYSFAPKAADADGDKLTFIVKNKPTWATFNTSTGALTGTPATAGSFANIVISVTDGKATAALPAFNLNVAGIVKGNATVTWTAPTQDVEGAQLADLAGFRVMYGTAPDQLTQTLQVPGASLTSVQIEDLTSGTYYFAVKAYTKSGLESSRSDVAWKTIL